MSTVNTNITLSLKDRLTGGLYNDKLSIRAELFMANLFDYNRRQQRAT